jgi:hypothetical protein
MMMKCLLTELKAFLALSGPDRSPQARRLNVSGAWCLLVVHPPVSDVTFYGNRDGGIATLLGKFLLISIGQVHEGPHLP